MVDKVFEIINTVVITMASGALLFPMLYTVLLLIPQKKYKPAKVQHKFAVIVCARNEEKVLRYLIDSVRAQDYPAELLDILVVAHNCKDSTAQVAREAGADIVLELNDPDPKHARKGYALNYAFDELLKNHAEHEAYIVMDADNLMDRSFVKEMNNALDAGVEIGTGYRNSKNYDDNCIAGSNGLTFLRDCRINAHARTLIHSTVTLAGTGFYICRKAAEDMGGWHAFNLVEDLEFTLQCLKRKHRVSYVSKAMFYDEQPHGFKDSLIRQTRLGKGVFLQFLKYGPQMLFKFFTTFRIGFLDMFLYLLYPPVAMLATLWFPFYYIYQPVTMMMAADWSALAAYGLMVLKMIVIFVVLVLTTQNIIVMLLERKRLNFTKPARVVTTLIAYPWYNLCCAVAITIGILNPKQGWKPTRHDRAVTLESIEARQKKGDRVNAESQAAAVFETETHGQTQSVASMPETVDLETPSAPAAQPLRTGERTADEFVSE